MPVLKFADSTRRLPAAPAYIPTPTDTARMDALRARFVKLIALHPAMAYWLMDFIDGMLKQNGV